MGKADTLTWPQLVLWPSELGRNQEMLREKPNCAAGAQPQTQGGALFLKLRPGVAWALLLSYSPHRFWVYDVFAHLILSVKGTGKCP